MTDRRSEIVAAATRVALEHGMDALTVRKVATEAGIGASTLRHYFPTQQTLYEAAAPDLVDRLSPDLQLADLRINDRRVSPTTRLTECLMQFLHTDGDGSELEQFANVLAMAHGPNGRGDLRAIYHETYQRGLAVIQGWVTVLANEGHVNGDIPQHTRTLDALLNGMAVQMLVSQGAITTEQCRETVRTVVHNVVLRVAD